jgi:hypothetical protein
MGGHVLEFDRHADGDFRWFLIGLDSAPEAYSHEQRQYF